MLLWVPFLLLLPILLYLPSQVNPLSLSLIRNQSSSKIRQNKNKHSLIGKQTEKDLTAKSTK